MAKENQPERAEQAEQARRPQTDEGVQDLPEQTFGKDDADRVKGGAARNQDWKVVP